MSSVLARVSANNTPERWERGRDVLGVAFERQQEIAIAAHGKLWKAKPVNYSPKHATACSAGSTKS